MNAAELIEINEETSVCECCGKTNLKQVAVIRLTSGSIVRYGTDCAAKALGRGIKTAIAVELDNMKYRTMAINFINAHQYKLNPVSIAASVSVKLSCYFDSRAKYFDLAGVKYTPDVYSPVVSWWVC